MKKGMTRLLILAAMALPSCTKKAPTMPITDPADPTAAVLYYGKFMNGPYGTTSGVAKIEQVNNRWQLRLDSFIVSNGPDLKVYLSRQEQPVNFISLGSLRSVSGSQVYPITGMPDIMTYRYALIHCEKYNHLFGAALLEMK